MPSPTLTPDPPAADPAIAPGGSSSPTDLAPADPAPSSFDPSLPGTPAEADIPSYQPLVTGAEIQSLTAEADRRKRFDTLQKSVLDPNPASAADFANVDPLDPVRGKKLTEVHAYLQLQNDGYPLQGGTPGERAFMARVASANGWPDATTDPIAFHGRMSQMFQKNADTLSLAQDLQTTAAQSALMAGTSQPGLTWDEWSSKNRSNSAWDPHHIADYFKTWTETQAAAKAALAPYQATLDKATAEMEADGWASPSTDPEVVAAAADPYFLGALRARAINLGKTLTPTFYGNVSTSDFRAGQDFVREISRSSEDLYRSTRGNPYAFAPPTPPAIDSRYGTLNQLQAYNDWYEHRFYNQTHPIDTFAWDAETNRIRQDRDRADIIRRIERGDYNPIHPVADSAVPAWAQNFTYAAPGFLSWVAPYTIPGVGPVTGPVTSYMRLHESSYETIRDAVLASGGTAEDARAAGEKYQDVLAVPQAILMEVKWAAIAGKIPGVKQLTETLLTPLKTQLLRGLAKGAFQSLEGAALMQAQGAMNLKVLDTLHTIDPTIPLSNWDQYHDDFWTNFRDSAILLSPLAYGHAAYQAHGDARNLAIFKTASGEQLAAFGIPAEKQSLFRKLIDQGPSAIDLAMGMREPNSTEAKAATLRLNAAIDAKKNDYQQAVAQGRAPITSQEPDGTYTVRDPSGQPIATRLPDQDTADKIADIHFAHAESDRPDTSHATDSPSNVFGNQLTAVPDHELRDHERQAIADASAAYGGRFAVVRPDELPAGNSRSGDATSADRADEGTQTTDHQSDQPPLDAAGERPSGHPGESGLSSDLPHGANWKNFQDYFHQVFQKNLVLIRAIDGQDFRAGGFNSSNSRNTIVINADTRAGLSYVTGHELGHAIEAQHPEIYAQLKKELLAASSDWADYQEKLKGLAYETRQQHESEFVNDLIGNQFGEAAFWKKLEAKNTPLFKRVVSAALDYLKDLGSRITGMPRDVRGYFTNIEAARDSIAKALDAYAKTGKFPDRILNESPDADLSGLSSGKSDESLTSPDQANNTPSEDHLTTKTSTGPDDPKKTENTSSTTTSKPAGDENSFTWWFRNPNCGITSTLSDHGVVDFLIGARENAPVRGTILFKSMMDHFGDKVKGVNGTWFSGTNFDKFNELTKAGTAPAEAALQTWTGRQAQKYGFTKVRILELNGEPGHYSTIKVIFEK